MERSEGTHSAKLSLTSTDRRFICRHSNAEPLQRRACEESIRQHQLRKHTRVHFVNSVARFTRAGHGGGAETEHGLARTCASSLLLELDSLQLPSGAAFAGTRCVASSGARSKFTSTGCLSERCCPLSDCWRPSSSCTSMTCSTVRCCTLCAMTLGRAADSGTLTAATSVLRCGVCSCGASLSLVPHLLLKPTLEEPFHFLPWQLYRF